MESKIYTLTGGKTVSGMAEAIARMLTNEENMTAQVLTADDGTKIVQGRGEDSTFLKFCGLNNSITVRIIPRGETSAQVEIGYGKWLEKATTAATGFVLLGPLFLVSHAIGTAKQLMLPGAITGTIEKYLAQAPAKLAV